ncbi:TPA: DNA repair protein RadC, partial [Vibrio vulnificus]|nr:DNA repair protein RadC [Vibrio vulnificus]
LKHHEREVFAVMFLDNQHRLIAFEELFFGTIDSASVYPREVLKAALKINAAALIFAHNHPSGDATPSQADKQITQRLKEALALVDIRVLDHIVVGDSAISFAERGLL